MVEAWTPDGFFLGVEGDGPGDSSLTLVETGPSRKFHCSSFWGSVMKNPNQKSITSPNSYGMPA